MRKAGIAGLVLVATVLASSSQAQTGISGPTGGAAAAPSAPARAQFAAQLVARWSNHIQEVYKTDPEQWAASMAPLFERASVDTLTRAAAARTFDAMNDELLRGDQPKAAPVSLGDIAGRLGDTATDLTFVPVAPCRIIDTRVTSPIIAAGTTVSFDIADVASYASQGGDASNCGGLGAAGSIAAIAVNFTVVSPQAGGFITAFPYNTVRPLAATMVYNSGQVVSNLAIVRLDQTSAVPEMSVYTFAATYLVADVVGYFTNPQATPLDCVQTYATVAITATQTFNLAIPACPVGYTMTGAGCQAPFFDDVSIWAINGLYPASPTTLGAFCAGRAAATSNVRGMGQCCRLPGR